MLNSQSSYRKSVFLVVYSLESEKPNYLILKRKLHWKGWEFPKGGKESLETNKETLLRELKEETNLTPLKIKKLNKAGSYRYDLATQEERGFKGQKYSLYGIEVKKGKVIIDFKEHSGFRWCTFEQAIKHLTWKDQKECLNLVHNSLNFN
ncbi:MAG: NUDIX domain-containing protein [Nanoarchaeota archaeon]|nr:NUDIX domain-containing protein [Nanoarchaeota archaeon]